MAETALIRLGYAVYSIENAEDALVEARKTDIKAGLLLSDVSLLGGMNGLELGDAIGEISRGSPTLFASRYTKEMLPTQGNYQSD